MRLRSFFMTGDNIPSKYNFSWYLRHCWRKFMHTLAALKRRQPTLTLSREQDHLVLSRKKKNSAEKMSQAFASPVHERTYQQALSYERTTPRLQLAANDEKYFTASGKIPTAFFRRRNVIYKKVPPCCKQENAAVVAYVYQREVCELYLSPYYLPLPLFLKKLVESNTGEEGGEKTHLPSKSESTLFPPSISLPPSSPSSHEFALSYPQKKNLILQFPLLITSFSFPLSLPTLSSPQR